MAIDLVGIGNALVDILQPVEDTTLTQLSLPKGGMTLMEIEEAQAVHSHLNQLGTKRKTASGGSVANSIALFSGLGGKAGFIGKLGQDIYGDAFLQDMAECGVTAKALARDPELPSGTCQIMITPDHERTMVTTLGASSQFSNTDLDHDLIEQAKFIYLEGYLFDLDAAKTAFKQAAELAHSKGNQVALSLSDAFCVDRHYDDFKQLVETQIDLLFANEAEALTLFKAKQMTEVVEALKSRSMRSVITLGEKGALIIDQGMVTEIAAAPVNSIKDLTGAGDAFAAGFLYGLICNKPLTECGSIAATLAAQTIAIIGARPLRGHQ